MKSQMAAPKMEGEQSVEAPTTSPRDEANGTPGTARLPLTKPSKSVATRGSSNSPHKGLTHQDPFERESESAGAARHRNPKGPERTTMKLAKLVPNALQDKYNDRTRSAGSIAALREDLLENGQRDPIHVMPPGNAAGLPEWTILDGHGRTDLLLAAGIEVADVIVRWDLLHADAARVERTFIQFNFNRRHDHPLDLAAKAVRLCEIKLGKPAGALRTGSAFTAMRDEVAAMTGWTGRHLLRMCRILLTPTEVQRLVRDGSLPMVDAEKVEALDRDKQVELAQRLGTLTDAREGKQVVREYLTAHREGRNKRPGQVTRLALRLIANLKRDLDEFAGRFDGIYGPDLVEHREFLAEAIAAFENLLAASQRPAKSILDLLKEPQLS
ncbi:MAG: hypothetical protein JWN40_2108 [Phycisphaerales bacterium]|nr:hypothetical protein [Phycisphaerales bacterium]